MIYRENINLKHREYNFQGLLDSGELEAQIKFLEQETIDYKKKLIDERVKNQENIQELKDEVNLLKK